MLYLVTGGAGFIGSNIVEELVSLGHKVRVLDNMSTGRRGNLEEFEEDISIIEGDIRNYEVVRQAVDGVDAVLHQAALPSVPRSIQDPILSNEVNVDGTVTMLKACVDAGVKRFVFASSSSVYGDTPQLPKHEDLPTNPLSPYAVSKLAGERYCDVFSRIYGIQTICLRYFNVFGPRQNPDSQYAAVIPKFIKAILDGESPIIYGDGEQSRDFTYVSNVVRANILASTAPCMGNLILNCACHGKVTLNSLVDEINGFLGESVEPVYAARRQGDIQHSFASITKAKDAIGYNPVTDFHDGLQATIAWYRQNHGPHKRRRYRSKGKTLSPSAQEPHRMGGVRN